MGLVFLFGLPGSGKLTVAKELSALTGWKLLHNHLTVGLFLAVSLWLQGIHQASRTDLALGVYEWGGEQNAGLDFTFNPEDTVRQSFIEQTLSLISKHSARSNS